MIGPNRFFQPFDVKREEKPAPRQLKNGLAWDG
jgi:hypothetical protein